MQQSEHKLEAGQANPYGQPGQPAVHNVTYGQPPQQPGHNVTYGQPIHQPQPTMVYSGTGVPVQMVPQPGMATYVVPGTVHQAPMYVYAPPVDRQALDLQYHTCCCHVTTATYIIGILESISLIISLVISIVQYEQYISPYYYESMIGCVISFVLGLLVLPPLFVGVYKEKAALLLPHIVFQSLVMIGCVAGVIMYGVYAANIAVGGYYDNDIIGAAMVIFIVLIVIFLIVLGVEIFFLVQVIRCYRYLAMKTRSLW